MSKRDNRLPKDSYMTSLGLPTVSVETHLTPHTFLEIGWARFLVMRISTMKL